MLILISPSPPQPIDTSVTAQASDAQQYLMGAIATASSCTWTAPTDPTPPTALVTTPPAKSKRPAKPITSAAVRRVLERVKQL